MATEEDLLIAARAAVEAWRHWLDYSDAEEGFQVLAATMIRLGEVVLENIERPYLG